MGLSKAKRSQVEKLLQAGKLSKRAIHRETGVSRITIDKIEHKLLYPEKKAPSPPPPKPKVDREKTVYTSCKGCGRKLLEHTPCIYCFVQLKQITEYDNYMNSLLTPGG